MSDESKPALSTPVDATPLPSKPASQSVTDALKAKLAGVTAAAAAPAAKLADGDGETPPGGNDPGTPADNTSALLAQARAALAGRVLVTVEDNPGFGRRTTAIVLCDSARYRREVTISAAPGRVIADVGEWRVAAVDGALALELAADGGAAPARLIIGEDTQGNFLLNGLTVQSGDPSVGATVCAGI